MPQYLVDDYERDSISLWRQVFNELPSDRFDLLGACAVLEKARPESKATLSHYDRLMDPNLQVQSLAPLLSRSLIGQAHVNIEATAVRLMQDRLRLGAFPTALPVYGDIAVDPYNRKPLRYVRSGDGFTLSSVGQPSMAAHAAATSGVSLTIK